MLHSSPADTDATLFDLLQQDEAALSRLKRIPVARGAVLIEQNTHADALYLVETGRFRVDRDGTTLAEVGPGETVGEIAFFTGGTRTANVIAARDSVVLRLTEPDYEAACAADPAFARAVARILARRLASTTAQVRPVPEPPQARTITVLPVGGTHLPDGFVTALGTALSGLTACVTITPDTAREALGARAGDSDIVAWLLAQEREGGHVIYTTDPEDDDWSRRVLRQSDQVLLVGRAGTPPELSPIERFAFDTIPEDQRRLALIHPEQRDWVTGTEHWLDGRAVFMHHHLAEGRDADMTRLARFLAGRARGFVAGGGGAFGAMHTGIYSGLRRRGISFDIFGGTSVGSAMTAGFAMGLDGEEIDRRTGDIFVKNAAMGKLTVPKYSILDHTVFDRQMRKHYTANLIENLWYPYFALATDLSENVAHVIRRGPLWLAMRASCAIPGVLPPVYTPEGKMLVDGGSMDNIPYRQMHALKDGPNVVVSFTKPTKQKFYVDYDRIPGRGTLLRRLVLPIGKRPPRAPGIVPVVMRAVLARQAADELALGPQDWHIPADPPKGAGFLDWRKHHQLFERGQNMVDTLLSEPFGPSDPRAAFANGGS